MIRPRSLHVVVALLVHAAVALSMPHRAAAAPAEHLAAGPGHVRLVWASSGPGTRNLHVRSGREDGTGAHRVYDNARGFTMALAPSPDGRRVAFVTCCRDDLPLLVVAPTAGGPHLAPLESHPELEAADGLAWSPDGTHLAFTAIVQEGAQRLASIWTVGLDGSDLQHVLTLGDVLADDAPALGSRMAWTRAGILYTEGGDLRLASAGTSNVVLERVWTVTPTADGRRLVLLRGTPRHRSVWIATAAGTGAREVARWRLDAARTYLDVVPNRDGSRLLAARIPSDFSAAPEWVAWDTRRGLRTAEVLPLPARASVVAWQ